MDPITAAIVAGLAAGATKVAAGALVDAYNHLKGLLIERFGGDSQVSKSVADVEARPESEPRKGMLAEAIADVKAAEDPKLVEAAKALLQQVEAQPGGSQIVLNVSGSGAAAAYGGIAAGQGGVAVGGDYQGSPPRSAAAGQADTS